MSPAPSCRSCANSAPGTLSRSRRPPSRRSPISRRRWQPTGTSRRPSPSRRRGKRAMGDEVSFFTPARKKLLSVRAELTLRCGVSAPGVPPVLITPRLSQKLQQTLGEEASAELMTWMQHVDARVADVATRADLAELRADLAELRQEMQVGFA